MARVLRTDVYVAGERYVAGSTPPDAIVRRITNPAAWEDEMTDPTGEQVGEGTQIHADPDPGPGAPEPRPGVDDGDDATVDLTAQRKAPPRSGRGSGVEAWEAFARANGVELPPTPYGRDDVIDACEDAGLVEPA